MPVPLSDRLRTYLLQHWQPHGWSVGELVSTMWPEGVLLVGLMPEGSELKGSSEAEPRVGGEGGALAAEPDALPAA